MIRKRHTGEQIVTVVKDMATRLQVKTKTIYAWASQGKIPCMKVNGVIRFDVREIEQWLQKCHVPVGPPGMLATNRRNGSVTRVDHLIESANVRLILPVGKPQ